MAVITNIDGIPLYSTQEEALKFASDNGLTGFHTHSFEGQIGYMGGIDHNNAVTGNSSQQNAPSGILRKIKIEKKVFEAKKTGVAIDKSFSQLLPKTYTIDEFFDLYLQLFYDIEKKGRFSHETIIKKSTEYAGTPPNPKDQEIIDLREQVRDVQFEIDSIPKEHPFLPNELTVIQSRSEPSLRYFMQAGRRRQIKSDVVFDLLKERTGYPLDTPNEDFCVLLNPDAIAGITPGPDINTQNDLTIDIATINRFTPGIDATDSIPEINLKIEQPDIRINPALPEMDSSYNPLANIEEPPPPPEALELNPIMNTNSFNASNVPLSTYRFNRNS
tara:strand:- start:2154 stop:3146 length:993 start_codon:yes stop_codon:yes gene_type:complete